ncbi:unnamed protein product [Urochloa humidicola]
MDAQGVPGPNPIAAAATSEGIVIEASGGSKPVGVVKVTSSSKMKAAEPMQEDSAPRVACKICIAKGENSASRTAGCPFCLAKAAALGRIKAAGGSIIEAEEESNAKPLAIVKAEYLDKVKAAGGCIMKTVPKKDDKGNPIVRVTVKLPESYMQGVLTLPPPVPLLPLSDDFFRKKPHLRESSRIGAAMSLYTIVRQENILASFYEKGYGTMDLEVLDFYDQ